MTYLLGYARVSTVDQNPDLQVDELTAAGCERVLVEQASGAQAHRPVLAEVLAQLRPGDTLVVWRLDRLARSLRELIEVLTSLEQQRIGFRTLRENIDTTTAGGKLVFHVFGALAEFERDLIRERTNAGLAAARARGRRGRRPTVMTAPKIARVGSSTNNASSRSPKSPRRSVSVGPRSIATWSTALPASPVNTADPTS